jgi:hypothetical protein
MDTFEINKILGALLGTLLFTLALNIVAGGIFTSKMPAKPGYEVAVLEQPAAGADDVHGRVQRRRNQTQTFLERVSRSAVTLPPFVVDGLCNADLRHPF